MSEAMRPIGRFSIDSEMAFENYDETKAIMGRCVIVRAEHQYIPGEFVYLAISDDFDLVQPGCEAPLYNWIVTRNYDEEGKVISFEVEAVKA